MKRKNFCLNSKLTGQSHSMPASESNKIGFINDIDGGPSFFPLWTNRKGDIWIDFIEAIDLKIQDTNDLIKIPDILKLQTEIDFWIKSIHPDDNPVRRLVYLKK